VRTLLIIAASMVAGGLLTLAVVCVIGGHLARDRDRYYRPTP
jgi:hypothetical protein